MDNKDQLFWDKTFAEGRDFSPSNVILLEKILGRITELRLAKNINSDLKTVIDLGGGTGDATIALAQKGFSVQLLDFSDIALKKADLNIKEKNLTGKVTLTKMDLENIDEDKLIYKFPDLALCKLVFAFIKDKKRFLNHIKKIIGNNGTLILMTPVLYPDLSYNQEDKPKIAVPFAETLSLLKSIFNQVEIFYHNYFGRKGDEIVFLITK